MRLATLLAVVALLASPVGAQDVPAFVPGGGPWAHATLVGEAGDGTIYAADPAGLIASTNGGLTWTLRAPGQRLSDVEAAPDGRLWAVRADGVVTSADGGATWALDGAFGARALALDGATLYAATATDVRRRTDAGWEHRVALPVEPASDVTVESLAARDGALAVGIQIGRSYMTSWRDHSNQDAIP